MLLSSVVQGVKLVHNASGGVIMSNQSLALRGVTHRRHGGRYQCAASNEHGHGASRQMALTVRYAPVCLGAETLIRGAERRQTIALNCSTDALPSATKYRCVLFRFICCLSARLWGYDPQTLGV